MNEVKPIISIKKKNFYYVVGVVLLTVYSFSLSNFPLKLIKSDIQEKIGMNDVDGIIAKKNSTYTSINIDNNATATGTVVFHVDEQKEEALTIINDDHEIHNNTDRNRDMEAKTIKEQLTQKIAYTIAITNDGNYVDDMAAVLAQSIKKNHRGMDYDLIALVHNTAISIIPKLELIGYNTTVVSTPLDVTMIKDQSYAQAMMHSGCCGENEFIKLHTFRMFNYKRVVYFDADAMLMKPLTKFLDMDKSLIYTHDYGNYDQYGNGKACVQGGFFIAKPSQQIFDNIIDVIMEGNYTKYNGWRHTHAGSCWGGETIQGVFSYYVNHMAAQDVYEADFCTVNNLDGAVNGTNFDCQMVNLKDVISSHFPNKKKPWKCNTFPPENKNMPIFHEIWWKIRNEIERERNWITVPFEKGCDNGTYTPIHYDSMANA